MPISKLLIVGVALRILYYFNVANLNIEYNYEIFWFGINKANFFHSLNLDNQIILSNLLQLSTYFLLYILYHDTNKSYTDQGLHFISSFFNSSNIYLLSPLVIMSTKYSIFQQIHHFLLSCFIFSIKYNPMFSGLLCLCLVPYCIYYVILAPIAIIAVLYHSNYSKLYKVISISSTLVLFVLWLFLSYNNSNLLTFQEFDLNLINLSQFKNNYIFPSLSIFGYLKVQSFKEFIAYFSELIFLQPFAYSLPISVRFYNKPLTAVIAIRYFLNILI